MVDENAVYISFNRSEDTIRHSFLSHLSADFHRRRLSWEEPASDHDRDATIAKSKVSLVILSEEYAFSKDCLDELLNVSKCRGNDKLVVVPVFYGLTKSVLRKQCLKLKDKYPNDRVADWRHALLEIADLPGHASSHERSDSELIEEIVADVRQKLDQTGKIGIYSRLMKIENLLCKQPWGIRSVGIWGMGGIGKTTLAEAAFEQLSAGDFEASCFIKDFDNAFQEKGVYGLLEENLGEKLLLRSPITREKLCNKRILLVLDDVHNPLSATKFLGWFELLGSGSMIIITSRDKQLIVQCRVNDIYKVQGLNEHEALQLFYRCALGKDVPHHNLPELYRNLVDYANGNPLALSVYGRELEGKNPSEMESAVRKLEQHFPDKIFHVLKRSYDALSERDKEIFLNIIFSFRGENVDNVKQFLSGCGFFPHVGIDVLVNKSLVTVSENRLQIHNLIHKVGLRIIKDQTEEIGNGYRLLDDFNIQSLVEEHEIEENEDPKAPPNLGNEDIKAIILDTCNLSFRGHVAFKDMYTLRYLKILNSNFPRTVNLEDLTEDLEFRFPEDCQSLPPKLRLLHWESYPSKSFPQDFDGQHLVELNMPYSKLLRLWEGTKSLEALKRITLSHSQQLVNVDELQYSRNLEKIVLQGCSRLQSFPDMDQLQHLQILDLSSCIKIKSVPKVPPSIRKLHLQGTGIREISILHHSSESEDLSTEESHLEGLTSQVNVSSSNTDLVDMVSFESLEVLDLSGCSELEEIQGFPQNLKKLYLAKTAIREIPFFLCHHLSELVTLDMEDCKKLLDLPMGMGNMKSLATLKLSGCSKLENIQDLPRNLKELIIPCRHCAKSNSITVA
ncbi:putative disease resistance protein [Cardamine amara subsp. amara]|uniref:Disease resistance protein n=1 Tax=Cardamine amara subsp. amara TaxID=228776 RepID=A0ABD1A5S6_CARAN